MLRVERLASIWCVAVKSPDRKSVGGVFLFIAVKQWSASSLKVSRLYLKYNDQNERHCNYFLLVS